MTQEDKSIEDKREEREKLIIKYLGMAYSLSVAEVLADEELELKND